MKIVYLSTENLDILTHTVQVRTDNELLELKISNRAKNILVKYKKDVNESYYVSYRFDWHKREIEHISEELYYKYIIRKGL